MAEAIIWTIFWICAGLGTIGAAVAAVTMLRSADGNYGKK